MRLPGRSGPARGRLLFVLLILGLSRVASAADGPNLIRLEITIGKSQVVELKEAFTRVSVTNPAIADVFVITPTQILINGKAVGTTSLIVFYPGRTMFFDVMVHTDVDLLRERLAQIAPRDEIQVYPTQDALAEALNITPGALTKRKHKAIAQGLIREDEWDQRLRLAKEGAEPSTPF